ncbi:MAG: PQQ-binding-like beta-propeller repeat protein, partial [Planctomycetaceae bacterium]|nr:PQQ-binding-like beta-propeller repeat protein [Planctomycetaceae bacterium]
LIVTAGPEGRAIFALDCSTGEEVWKAEANSLGNVWGTPIIVPGPEGRTDIVIGAPYEVWGLNAETGRLSWYCEAVPEDSYSSSVVLSEGLIYGISGRQGGSFAIRAGGTGEITETHTAWTGRDRNRYSTPVVVNGRLYHISSNIVACLNAQTGEEIYRERLSGAPESSSRGFSRGGNYTSPVVVGDHLFYVSDQGETYVLKLGDQFEQVAVNRVTENSETFAATPAIDQGAILIRSDRAVYCIESK